MIALATTEFSCILFQVDKMDDNKKESARSRKETAIRHHLERTTGAG